MLRVIYVPVVKNMSLKVRKKNDFFGAFDINGAGGLAGRNKCGNSNSIKTPLEELFGTVLLKITE